MSDNCLHIGKKRCLFWDDYLIDREKTTAFHRLIQPTLKDVCYVLDCGDELESVSYPCIVKDENGYKMYYTVWKWGGGDYTALIESKDGIEWARPNLKLFLHPELEINNACIDAGTRFVFYDTNPDCPKNERYKALGPYDEELENGEKRHGLWYYVSSDGYSFTRSHCITNDGHFDSLNTAF